MDNFISKFIDWAWDIMERYILFWVIVRDYEAGVVLFLGKYDYTLKKGFNWKLPLLHESLTCLTQSETIKTPVETIITKDNKTISISFVGRYEVYDEKRFLLQANDSASNIPHELIMAGCDYLTDCDYLEVIDKKSYTKIKSKVNSRMEYMGAKFTEIGYGTNTITRPISLINN